MTARSFTPGSELHSC